MPSPEMAIGNGCFVKKRRRARVHHEPAAAAIFFLLLMAATVAGAPEVARPMSTLDYIDAILPSFTMPFLFTLWSGKRLESAFILHGAFVGVVGILLFTTMWVVLQVKDARIGS